MDTSFPSFRMCKNLVDTEVMCGSLAPMVAICRIESDANDSCQHLLFHQDARDMPSMH